MSIKRASTSGRAGHLPSSKYHSVRRRLSRFIRLIIDILLK
jgi:hypothetical protein